MSPETKPYIYSQVLPIPSMFPPYRTNNFRPDGYSDTQKPNDEETWIIFYPSQPEDDDVYVVYWTGEQWEWKAAGYGQFGEPYKQLDENSAMILLEFFDLQASANAFSPSRLQNLSPEALLQESQARAAKKTGY
jgi:hypothetical protein